MRAFKNFIFYNNTIPIVFGVVFLGTSLTFAASEDAREAVISSESALTSVDNTFIRNVNLETYDVEVFVNSIEEDDDFYYVSYTVSTVGLADGIWQPITDIRELQVSKVALGDNDLGLRVSKELSDIYESEKRLLRETQEIEKNVGQTNKVITTKYNGIVGRMLDPENEVFPGYDPVVTPPPAIPGPKPKQFTEELDNGQSVVVENQGGQNSQPDQLPAQPAPTATTSPETTASTTPPTTGTTTPEATPATTTPSTPEPEEAVSEPGPVEQTETPKSEEPISETDSGTQNPSTDTASVSESGV